MSSIVAALLFSAAASAQMTTSLWWLDSASSSVAYQASVVRVSNSMTTMAVTCDYDNDQDCYYEDAETMVFGGNTYWESTTSNAATESYGDYTMSVACSMTKANSPPLCTASEGGYGAWQEYCSTDDGMTYTDDFDYSTSLPDFCSSSGSTLPESVAVITTRLPLDYLQYHEVTITAGEELLGAAASTGAAASSTGAFSTGKSTFTLAATTGSTASSSGPSATGSTSSTGSASGTAAPVQTAAAAHFAAPIAGMAAVAMAAFAL